MVGSRHNEQRQKVLAFLQCGGEGAHGARNHDFDQMARAVNTADHRWRDRQGAMALRPAFALVA
jgi:hypothetical protein